MKERQRSPKQTMLYLALPLLGAGFIGYLLSLLDKDALWMGGTWLLIGIVYHLVQKRTAPSKNATLTMRAAAGSTSQN
ncbi:hypothetical protein D3C87_2086930 [compost metagenome]